MSSVRASLKLCNLPRFRALMADKLGFNSLPSVAPGDDAIRAQQPDRAD